MTGILSGLQPMGNISFRFAILISGYPSNATSHAEIMKDKAIQNVRVRVRVSIATTTMHVCFDVTKYLVKWLQ
jgi:hypothetical protein